MTCSKIGYSLAMNKKTESNCKEIQLKVAHLAGVWLDVDDVRERLNKILRDDLYYEYGEHLYTEGVEIVNMLNDYLETISYVQGQVANGEEV